MTMGRDEDKFYLLRPHTLLPYTYMLPYSYQAGWEIESYHRPNGFGYPLPIPSHSGYFFYLIKVKVFFIPKRNVVMNYPTKRWWQSMAIVTEKREAENVRFGRRKAWTIISEYDLKDWDSDCVSEMIQALSFYLYKRGNKLILYNRDGFEYEFRVGTYILVTHPIPLFWNREKPKPIPQAQSKREKPVKLSLVWAGCNTLNP